MGFALASGLRQVSRVCGRALGVAALCVLCLLLSACRSELFARLDESDANAVVTVLYLEGIKAHKMQVEGAQWRIEVDEIDYQRALQVASSNGLPRERFTNIGELFKKEGLVSTPSELRLRYMFALSQELSNTLSRIDGVISARVHPVIPVKDPLSDKVQPASAAVFIKHLPDADLQQMAPAIRTLVARSIEGLQAENVSLTFFSSRLPVHPRPSSEVAVAAWGYKWVSAVSAGVVLACGFLGWALWRRRAAGPPAAATAQEASPTRLRVLPGVASGSKPRSILSERPGQTTASARSAVSSEGKP